MRHTIANTCRRGLGVALAVLAVPAAAQEGPPAAPVEASDEALWPGTAALPATQAGTLVYVPQDFAAFAPRTALELIERIPGFDLPGGGFGGGGGGGGTARGFGEASGNILINGTRLSSKSTSERDQLARIPVSNVIRIEVVDGSTLDIPGLSGRVANLIVDQGGMTGQFVWRPQLAFGIAPFLWNDGNISVSGRSGAVDYTVALNGGGFSRGSQGETLFRDGAGVADLRFNSQSATFSRPTLSAALGFDLGGGVDANLNLSAARQFFRSREQEQRLAGNPLPAFDERFRTLNDERAFEISGDIEFPLGPGRLKLIALEQFEHGNFRTQSLLDTGTLATTGSRYTRVQDLGERIGRGEYRWRMIGADWQLSAEAAFNRLDQVASLFRWDDALESYQPVPFPSGIGGVREDRYESILSVGFPLASGVTLQLAGGAEHSTLAQTGSGALERRFFRPKGTLNLAWAVAPGTDVSFELARRVGQLNFGDFLASVNLAQDNSSAGNNQLRPPQSWEAQLEIVQDLGAWGSATLKLFDHRVEDFMLWLPVPGGEARGNIDSARRYGLQFNATLQLDEIGFRGARLDPQITAEHSRLTDPVTGETRAFDSNAPFEIRLDFRHDVPGTAWAWGSDFRYTDNAPYFRVFETGLEHNPATFGALFVEHKDVFGLTVRARLANVFKGRNVYRRTLHSGPRDVAPVLLSEDRALTIGRFVQLTISGSF